MFKQLYTLCAIMVATFFSLSAFAAVRVTATPADGSTVQSLRVITLYFPDITVADNGSAASNVTVSDGTNTVACSLSYGTGEQYMVVTLSQAQTEAGTYTVNFPTGAFSLDGVQSEAFTLTYYINAADVVTFTPADGATVGWLSRIVYHEAGDLPSYYTKNYSATEQASLTDSNGNCYYLNALYDSNIGAGNGLLGLDTPITTPGTYTLNVPEKVFAMWANGGYTYSKAGQATYTVTGEGLTNVTWTPAPDDHIIKFQTLTITFPDYEEVSIPATPASVYIYRDDNNYVGGFSSYTVEGNTVTSSIYNPSVAAGHYYANFPEGAFLLGPDKVACSPFSIEFNVSDPEPINITMTPEENSEVDWFGFIQLNFPDEQYVTVNTNGARVACERLLDDGSTRSAGGAYSASDFVKVEGASSYIVDLGTVNAIDGQYAIYVPANTFLFGENQDRFNQNDTLYLNVRHTTEMPKATPDPESGTTMARVQKLTLSFPDFDKVYPNTRNTSAKITLWQGRPAQGYYGATGSTIGTVYATGVTPVEGKDNAFEVDFISAGIEAGLYTVSISEGMFFLGEDKAKYNATDTIFYYADGSGLDKIEVDPSTPVTSLQNFSITYVNETAISLQNQWAGMSFYKVNPEQSWDDYQEYVSASSINIEGNTMNITLSKEYTDEGQYYVEISEYLLYLSDGVTRPTKQRVYFTVDPNYVPTSISSLRNEGAEVMYDLQGNRISTVRPGQFFIQQGKKQIAR